METQNKLYVARDGEQGHNHLFLYKKEPVKNLKDEIWTARPFEEADGPSCFALPDNWFSNVKWTDEKATEVTLIEFIKYKDSKWCSGNCSKCTGELVCPGASTK